MELLNCLWIYGGILGVTFILIKISDIRNGKESREDSEQG